MSYLLWALFCLKLYRFRSPYFTLKANLCAFWCPRPLRSDLMLLGAASWASRGPTICAAGTQMCKILVRLAMVTVGAVLS